MKNGIFTLDWKSIADAVVTAAVYAVVAGFVTLVTTSGFDIFTTNWAVVGQHMANWALIAGVVSLGQSLITTNTGSVAGVTPEN